MVKFRIIRISCQYQRALDLEPCERSQRFYQADVFLGDSNEKQIISGNCFVQIPIKAKRQKITVIICRF